MKNTLDYFWKNIILNLLPSVSYSSGGFGGINAASANEINIC